MTRQAAPAAFDNSIFRRIGLALCLVPLVWIGAVLLCRWIGQPTWPVTYALFPCWLYQALVAAYYVTTACAAPRLRAGGSARVALAPAAAGIALGLAAFAAATSIGGWQAGLTALLAAPAWVAFAWVRSAALRRLLGIEGALASAAVTLYCAAFPLLLIAFALAATYLTLSLVNRGMEEGRLEGAIATAAIFAACLPALILSRRATRRARAILAEAGRATSAEQP